MAGGFVTSQDFTVSRFSSFKRPHGRSAFSGCRVCSVIRFQGRLVMVLFTRLQRQPVLFLHEISLTAGLVRF